MPRGTALTDSAFSRVYKSISLCFSLASRLAFLNTDGSIHGMCGFLPSNKSSTVIIFAPREPWCRSRRTDRARGRLRWMKLR